MTELRDEHATIEAEFAAEITSDLPTVDESVGNLTAVREEVEKYRRADLAVCRIRHGEKRPRDAGWTTRSARQEQFQPGDGIGLVCGWLSNGGMDGRFLVCVDLDTPKAIAQADEFLPPTRAIEGRDGKPRSHWWYFVTDVPVWATSEAEQAASAAAVAGHHAGPFKKGFNHAETGVRVIDFQGTGGQAVVPPSLHEGSGERRRWEIGCSIEQIATVPFGELWGAVCDLAKSCDAIVPDVGPTTESAEPEASDKAIRRAPNAASPTSKEKKTCTRECDMPMDERARRCERYLQSVDLARSGRGGHNTTFRVAKIICNDFAVTDRDAAHRLIQVFNARIKEAGELEWTDTELNHKLDDAIKALDVSCDSRYPFGCKLKLEANRNSDTQQWGDPSPLADAFVERRPVVFFSGRYFVYNGRNYDEVDANTLKAHVWTFIEQEAKRFAPEQPPRMTRALRDGVVAAIEARGVARLNGRAHEVAFNAWLPGVERSGDTLVVRNGLLDVATGMLSPHTPDFLGLYCLPYDFDPAAKCPTWEAVVDRIGGSDTELKLLIQQWFGYCLTTSTDQQKFMVLVGEGANGKSTLVGGLQAVIGAANASHVALEKFSGTFDLGYTLGKLVNVPDDMSEIDKANEGVLKTYTSGGAMAFNQKNRPILSARPTAKLLFATNTVPRFSDRSGGLWRRLLLVPLSVVIPEGERVKGMDKPGYWDKTSETAGMLNWALAGLRSLREANGFVVPACVRQAVAEHQLESNPTRQFIAEHLEEAAGDAIASSELFKAYVAWISENGYKPMGHSQFTKELRRIFPGVTRDNRRFEDKKSVKAIVGVRWIAGAVEASQS